MPIPPELKRFSNEADLVQNFLVPLLGRLGFTIVVPYHGKQEFGKDLVIGEIDRFNHVRYHGVQAKHVESISQGEIHSLIQDCDEAFSVDFTHPQTGQAQKISSFYAINSGSCSDQAKELYFKSLRPKHGDNVRLLEGRDLVSLDRSVMISRVESARELLLGLLHEVVFNENVLAAIEPRLKSIAEGDGHHVAYPLQRVRHVALASYLVRPYLGNRVSALLIDRLWTNAVAFNHCLDGPTSAPLQTVVTIKVPALRAIVLAQQLNPDLVELRIALMNWLHELGPLAPM